jgi:hypothetical protein
MASMAVSTVPNPVMITVSASGAVRAISSSSAMPPILGIFRSLITRSKCCLVSSPRAAVPSSAVRTL